MINPKIVGRCKGIIIQKSPSSDDTGIFFDTEHGPIGIVMAAGEVGLLMSMILEHATATTPKKSGVHNIVPANFDPIKAQAISIEKGPTEDTAAVGFMIGNINITFTINKTAVLETCKRVVSEKL